MVPKIARLSWLLDFYGPLLTERQRRMVELHCHDDLSLAEIAEEYGVSRQAVHDGLKRAERALEGFEERLGLLSKFLKQQEALENLGRLLSGPGRAEERLAEALKALELLESEG